MVLAVKGSLRRARPASGCPGRALDRCGPFCSPHTGDGRLRRESNLTPHYQRLCPTASDPPAGPRLPGDCATEPRLPMRPTGCFEAGRFTQTQSSWTASSRSRKWMSGHADALTLVSDRRQHTQIDSAIKLPANSSSSPGGPPSPLSTYASALDRFLSWMSPVFRFSVLSPGSIDSLL